jgi:hypothetical protein
VSPSWRNRLAIGLAPERVAVVQLKRGLRPTLGADRVRACAEASGAPWAGALETLDALLGELPAKGGTASVVLSNQFVRYVEVPWTTGVYSDKDRLALASDCFRAVHGEAADHWQVVLDAPHFGRANLAAAVDRALVDGLRATLANRHLRLGSLRPHLAAAFDLWRSQLQADEGGFVVVEPGCVTALFRRGEAWSAVTNRRYRPTADEAMSSVRQCIDADRLQGGEGAVALLAPGGAVDAKALGDRPVRRLTGLAGPWPEDPWRTLAWSAA